MAPQYPSWWSQKKNQFMVMTKTMKLGNTSLICCYYTWHLPTVNTHLQPVYEAGLTNRHRNSAKNGSSRDPESTGNIQQNQSSFHQLCWAKMQFLKLDSTTKHHISSQLAPSCRLKNTSCWFKYTTILPSYIRGFFVYFIIFLSCKLILNALVKVQCCLEAYL